MVRRISEEALFTLVGFEAGALNAALFIAPQMEPEKKLKTINWLTAPDQFNAERFGRLRIKTFDEAEYLQ